jgi:hypothetical protein
MASLRFGKHPPKQDYRTLRFSTYLSKALAPPPASHDGLKRVLANLPGKTVKTLFPMDGNDKYGDCTIAGAAHAVTTYDGLIADLNIMKEQDVLKVYFHLSGGNDTGLVELDVLNYWRKNAISGSKILAFVSLNPKNHVHVQQAILLFGGVYLGFQVQEKCLADFNAGRPWKPGKLTHDGHAVFATGYDKKGVTVLTWGNKQQGTWAWWDECVDEAYALLPPQAADPNFAPEFNLKQLKADLEAVAN